MLDQYPTPARAVTRRNGPRGTLSLVRGSSLALFACVATSTLAPACGPRINEVPPLGEVLVVVDTDMPVPRIVSRLRVDVYTTDHVWYVSRDISRSRLEDWPTSFSVYLPEGAAERDVLVRLRAYPQGEVRDYRGERFAARPKGGDPFALTPVPPPTDEPRLQSEDFEATPATEPSPNTAIDRLVRLHIVPAQRSAVRLLLHGACIGTMADLANETSCVDTEDTRVPVTVEEATSDMTTEATSRAGSFDFAQKCTAAPRPPGKTPDGTPLHDEEVCVDGALFLFGSNSAFGFSETGGATKRAAILPPFRMDRYEVTVARWRDALAKGFVPPVPPYTNDAPIPRDGTVSSDTRSCTYSTVPIGREEYPMACLTYAAARSFCQWSGGDLPTEAQWEYVAMEAGRPSETTFPWGGDPGIGASCERAVFGRGALPINNDCNKDGAHYGLVPVTDSAGPEHDQSLGLGVVGMSGSVSEMLVDAFALLTSNCWNRQPLFDPACRETAKLRSTRGASFALPRSSNFSARRFSYPADDTSSSAEVGFRCVRPGL